MILYHTVSTYHILRSILHKLNYRKNDDAILLVPQRFMELPYGLKYENNIFSKVIFYDWEFRQYKNYPDDVFSDIDNVLCSEIGIDYKEQITEYNIFYAARFMGSFLACNGIHFNWFEEADGRYLQYEPPMLDDKRMHKKRYELASSFGLYTAENECIDTIYLSLDDNPGVIETGKIKNFDVVDEIINLAEEDSNEIIRFWGIEEKSIMVSENSAMLMTQHFCNIRLISFEEQVLLYQMFTDYFLDDYKIYLKMHPSDNFPYGAFINNITDIKAKYPSELLKFALVGKFDIVAAVSSTGVLNLRDISDRQLCINQDYTFNFRNNDLYYFAAVMCKKFSGYKIICAGIDECILKNMMSYSVNYEGIIEIMPYSNNIMLQDTIIIIDENIEDEVIDSINESKLENVIICILSTKASLSEMEIIKRYHATAKKITTRSMEDEELITQKNVIVISDKEENIRSVDKMKYYRLLKNSQLVVRVDENLDKDSKILVLEGLLDATEKTLLKYVQQSNTEEINK